ncbi:Ribosome biogenesis protein brx1 [Hypoxylon texense]
MASTISGSRPFGLETLTPELVLKILENLCPKDATALLLASEHIQTVFNNNNPYYITHILKQQAGIENILYLYTAQRVENHHDRMLHPRIINVEYNDSRGAVNINMMGQDVQVYRYLSDVPLVYRTNVFTLSMTDVIKIWNKMKTIDQWIDLLPRVIWRDDPESRRRLSVAEETRARMALSRWWLYAHHHHGFYHSWRSFQQPKKWDHDTRMNHIRRLGTDEILELQDLWTIVRDVVSRDLCSSPERICRCEDGYIVDLVPWGEEDGRHERIVSTYMKLGPEQLLHYLEHYSNWKRSTAINIITQDAHLFTRDVETLSVTMDKVLDERRLLQGLPLAVFPACTIIDNTRAPLQNITPWTNDASPDGKSPLTAEEARNRNLPMCHGALCRRGDDGSDECLPH